MRVLFVGMGSIGTRHIVNLQSVLNENKQQFEFYVLRSSERELTDSIKYLITKQYRSFEELGGVFDIAFITNPTSLHYKTIKTLKNICKHFFIEKPVFDSPSVDLDDLSLSHESEYYVACPLRYTPVLKFVKNQCNLPKVISAQSICSTYLPNWRKNIDYRETYSAHKNMGGGVSIDLIHEWDYLYYLFGPPINIENMRGKFSNLEIDSEDLSIYIAKYPDKIIEVHLDYFGIKSRRTLRLWYNNDCITADFINKSVYSDVKGLLASFDYDANEMYLQEMRHFLNIVNGNAKNKNSIQDAIAVLNIAARGKLL